MMKSWQKWLSYIYDIEIETVDSKINGLLSLYISNGEYQLCTSKAIYSWGLKYYNFLELFNTDKVDLPKDEKNVLVLGMGMGSIPMLLEQKFKQKYNYTAVELDKAIIHLASKYTLPDLKSPIDIIEQDARLFIDQHKKKYDLICVDIFLDSVIPEYFETEDFLSKTKKLLTEDGQLILNRLFYYEEDKIASNRYKQSVFSNVFPQNAEIPTHKNLMLIGINDSN